MQTVGISVISQVGMLVSLICDLLLSLLLDNFHALRGNRSVDALRSADAKRLLLRAQAERGYAQ